MDEYNRIKEVATEVANLEKLTGLPVDILSQLIDWLVTKRGWSYPEALYIVKGLLFGEIMVK